MKFTPKELMENVNVSATHPLAEFAWLVGGLAAVIVGIYLLLGVTADLAAARMSPEMEGWLGERALAAFDEAPDPALDLRLQALLQALPTDSPVRHSRFRVHLVKSETVNAAALPGGHIVVFSGLLQKVRSENELSMVLAHELGHFAHRDHLRGLGRGLGFAVVVQLLLGANSAGAEFVSNLSLPLMARYSKAQEIAADEFAVDLTAARYGHAGGCSDFFTRLAAETGGTLPYLLASHPHPADRIARIDERIRRRGYPLQPVEPLAVDLKTKS